MKIDELPRDKIILLYDGVCTLCDASVQFIIRHDAKDTYRFVSLQSQLGREILHHIGVDSKTTDSLVFYKSKKDYYTKAAAVIRVLISLGGVYSLFRIALYLPSFFTNFVYDVIAKNRYKWFGMKQSCIVPSPEIMHKFL